MFSIMSTVIMDSLMHPWYNICRRSAIQYSAHSSRIGLLQRLCVAAGLHQKNFTKNHCVPLRSLKSSFFIHYESPITSYKLYRTVLCTCSFSNDCESDSESDSEEVLADVMDLCTEREVKDADSFRQLLYPKSDDSLIQTLKTCESVQEVFDIIREHETNMNVHQASQAVLVLWDLQKMFYRVNAISIHDSDESSTNTPQVALKSYINEISKHEDFLRLLKLISSNCEQLSADASTCMLLYLNKMGISMRHQTMLKLIERCEKLTEQLGIEFPLTALSRFTVAIHSRKGLWPFFIWKNTLPLVLHGIDCCKTAEDFRLLTICLNNCHQMISQSTLESYKSKALELVEERSITAKDYKAIIKAVNFLNYPHWSQMNTDVIRRLMLVLKGKITQMDARDLVYLHKVFQGQLEPADMLEEIQKHASKLLSEAENERDLPIDVHTTTELLSCIVSFSSPSQKKMFEELAQRRIESTSFTKSMPSLFMILRHLKTSNVELCDLFWSQTLENLDKNLYAEREDYKLLRICHRYMHFNNNLGGTYRHFEFEKRIKEWLLLETETGMAGMIPAKFARVAAFMLAYGIRNQKLVDNDDSMTAEYNITNKLQQMESQFNVVDCLNISRGLQISMELRHTRSMSPSYVNQFVNVNAAMNRCARRQLEHGRPSLLDINMIMRGYINRKGPRDTDLFTQLVQRYETNDDVLSSRLLRDIVFNLQATSCLVPRMVDRLVEYVIQNNTRILGDTAEKVLYLCYLLGYTPSKADVFLPIAADLIMRDKERMSGLALLHGALALCYFQKLPESFIHILFTVEFLERLDDEISHCYSKATYPMRMRHHLMQLNRAVCLDYPDADVPWFHTKYCQDIASLEGSQTTSLHKDVMKSITHLVGPNELVQTDVYSPYSYKIDFQILLNEKNNPVHARRQSDSKITRVAILLHKAEDFSKNVHQLKGQHQLQQRHLEMLGYRVIGISATLWNSMYMTEPNAKENYLRDKIWPSSIDVAS